MAKTASPFLTEADRAPPPPRPAPLSGICASCARAPGCTFTRDPSLRIHSCGEFEGFPAAAARPADPPPAAPRTRPARGLCSTCEAYASCTLPRPEFGVWRCEEFR